MELFKVPMTSADSFKNPDDEDTEKKFKHDSLFAQTNDTMERFKFKNRNDDRQFYRAQTASVEEQPFANILELAHKNYYEEISRFEPKQSQGQILTEHF